MLVRKKPASKILFSSLFERPEVMGPGGPELGCRNEESRERAPYQLSLHRAGGTCGEGPLQMSGWQILVA